MVVFCSIIDTLLIYVIDTVTFLNVPEVFFADDINNPFH
jgi:hypothetical protein